MINLKNYNVKIKVNSTQYKETILIRLYKALVNTNVKGLILFDNCNICETIYF